MRIGSPSYGLLVTLPIVLTLAACGRDTSNLQRFPTAVPPTSPPPLQPTQPSTPLSPTPTAVPPPTAPITPTPPVTAPPIIALPDSSGVWVACPANTLRLALDRLPGGSVSAVTRLAADGDWLYLLIDGGLYRAERLGIDLGAPQLERVLAPGDVVAGRPVHELVDVVVDSKRGQVYLLDKIGHVYRYEPVSKLLTLTYRIDPDQDFEDDLPNQVVAIELDGQGRVLMLDTAHGALWTPEGIASLTAVNHSRSLTSGVDVASAGGELYVLGYDGAIRRVSRSTGSVVWQDAEGRRLALTLKTSNHLGIEMLLVVDALRREVIGLLPGSGQEVTRIVFGFLDMSLLRDVVFSGGRLYATAGTDLFVYPGPATDSDQTSCPPPNPATYARPTLYGKDVLTALQDLIFPIEGGTLPTLVHVYPGALRLYRMGVHQGVDLYASNAPPGFNKGWPVLAMGDGLVLRASLIYVPLSEEEYNQMLDRAKLLGQTPPEALDRLAGRQIVLDHGNGLYTAYYHLDEIAPGVVTGASVQTGQVIGTVGLTGTEGELRRGTVGPHLHFEIRIGDHYLGQWITLRETMWWFEQAFAP